MVTVDIFKDEENTEDFAAGQTIFKEGEPGELMYVVQAGEVDIMVRDQLIETVGPGGMLGEMALADASARSATAIAKTDCKLVPLDARRFQIHVHHTPYFAIQVIRVIADRLRRMNERLSPP
jgi:CRP-like cAMP-binding protein